MGRIKKSSERAFGPQRALTVKSRMLTLLREELGLGRQPKVARLLVDELFDVIDECYRSASAIAPGQVMLLVPKIGTGPRREHTMAQIPLVPVCVTLVCYEDIELLAAGKLPAEMRVRKLCRMAREAYEQGGTLSTVQLAVLTGIALPVVKRTLKEHREKTGEFVPQRGIVEDMGSCVSHKALIVRLYLQGFSVTEIARKTLHAPSSIERYIGRFNQIKELVQYMGNDRHPEIIGRIVRCGPRLVKAYLALLDEHEKQAKKRVTK